MCHVSLKDYLGETAIGSSFDDGGAVDQVSGTHPFPWHVSNCGDIDLVGHQKPQSLYRTVLWGAPASQVTVLVHRPIVGAKQHVYMNEYVSPWGWPDEEESWTWHGHEGTPLQVRVFAKGCREAVLSLDGKHVATAPFQPNLTAVFNRVDYHPGTLEVQALHCQQDGNGRRRLTDGHAPKKMDGSGEFVNLTTSLSTTGAFAALRLAADRSTIRHDRGDLAYVTVEAIDAQGRRVLGPDVDVTFAVLGSAAEVVAVGSGSPVDASSFLSLHQRTWRGRCVVILRPAGADAGTIVLTATAQGVASVQLKITSV